MGLEITEFVYLKKRNTIDLELYTSEGVRRTQAIVRVVLVCAEVGNEATRVTLDSSNPAHASFFNYQNPGLLILALGESSLLPNKNYMCELSLFSELTPTGDVLYLSRRSDQSLDTLFLKVVGTYESEA